jgi:PAT family beta-lactamase induction signal transducer AmpG
MTEIQREKPQLLYFAAQAALAAVLLLLLLPWLTVTAGGAAMPVRGIDLVLGWHGGGLALTPSMTFLLGLIAIVAALGLSLPWRGSGGASVITAASAVGGVLLLLALLFLLFSPP